MGSAMSDFTDYDAIIEAIEAYIDGAKTGRGADMQPAFYEDAIIFGFADDPNSLARLRRSLIPSIRSLLRRDSRRVLRGLTSSVPLHKSGLNSTTGTGSGTRICSRFSKTRAVGR